MKKLLLFISIFMLAGCEERFRYPCQDPKNWGEVHCKKPFCSANGTCPEDLTHYEKEKPNAPVSTMLNQPGTSLKKGECK
jgi:hypothetical protein